MHVKTYSGPNTQAVLAQVKEELGPDAVILSSRSFRKGGVRLHEVTAGIERIPNVNNMTSTGTIKNTAGSQASSKAQSLSHLISNAQSSAGFTAQGGHINPPGWSEWHKEWLQVKEHLFALMKPSIQLEKLTPRQRVALEYLQREGVSDVVALELYRRLLANPGASVLESLSELVPVKTWGAKDWPQRVHCVTGPYGVGKTTSALRMALNLRAGNPDLRIAFINADCQRGNGRLILRHWAELSDFSYVEARDKQSMEKALIANAHADKIFIDMPGIGLESTLHELKVSLGLEGDVVEDMATHIVLSPSYDGAQVTAFLQRYASNGITSLVWAKLDECVSYGTIVNAATACNIPVSALSFGAELRDTLSGATESQLWRLIFKRQLPSADGLNNKG